MFIALTHVFIALTHVFIALTHVFIALTRVFIAQTHAFMDQKEVVPGLPNTTAAVSTVSRIPATRPWLCLTCHEPQHHSPGSGVYRVTNPSTTALAQVSNVS